MRILNFLKDKFFIDITTLPEDGIERLPDKLWPFMWFFLRQIKGLLILILSLEFIVAITVSLLFWYVGQLVEDGAYTHSMLVAGVALMVLRVIGHVGLRFVYEILYIPYFGNLVRRQLYWYTARQSLSFFQNDFAGRIANKLIQAPALRDAVESTVGAVWFALIFTISNLWLMTVVNAWLTIPLLLWLVGYILTLICFVPKVQRRSTVHAESMSTLTGQVVDSLTNFLPTKYFARTRYEDRRVIGLLQDHSDTFRAATGTIFQMTVIIDVLNVLLLIGTAAIGFWLIETTGQAGVAAMAMALPMALQATFQSGWIMFEVANIFENVGRVQEIVDTLSKPHTIIDNKEAKPLEIQNGQAEIAFKNVTFHYGQDSKTVMEGLSLNIPAGQKIGLVGRSGAGKSTVTSLLVRAYDVEGGEILINGQNISHITQNSLRRQITVITQDSYLFHRSVMENIRYGYPDASMEQVMEAARQANAHEFILGLSDSKGRTGYKALVGERGVKLSGGQRQRVGIARALLKNAPILMMDEATSALDSESEHAIQTALDKIMKNKTVIAIAHRLSTLRQMDRIIVMDQGRIIEDGTHDDLIAAPNGHYAKMWAMQSGGFLVE